MSSSNKIVSTENRQLPNNVDGNIIYNIFETLRALWAGDPGETDSRLDKGIESMRKLLVAIENVNVTLNNANEALIDMNSNLGGETDTIG